MLKNLTSCYSELSFLELTASRCYHFLMFWILSPQILTLTIVLSHLSFSGSPSCGSDRVVDDCKWRFVQWLLMGHGSDDWWGRGSFFCRGLLDRSQLCFSTMVFLNGGGLLGCLMGLGGVVVGCVVGCASGLRPLVVGLWWLGC